MGTDAGDVGRVPPRGVGVGRVPSRGEVEGMAQDARSGDRAYMKTDAGDAGRVTSRGGSEDKATALV